MSCLSMVCMEVRSYSTQSRPADVRHLSQVGGAQFFEVTPPFKPNSTLRNELHNTKDTKTQKYGFNSYLVYFLKEESQG